MSSLAGRPKKASSFRTAQAHSIRTSTPTTCIGCATCTTVCPEGDVLAMLAGKAVIVNGHKCIGHGLCADACPVGAITMVMANPSMARGHARPDAGIRNQRREPVHRRGTRRLGADQECRQSGARLRGLTPCAVARCAGSRQPTGCLRRVDCRRRAGRYQRVTPRDRAADSTTSPSSRMRSAEPSPSIRGRSW